MHKKRRVGLEYTSIDGNTAIWYNKVQTEKVWRLYFIYHSKGDEFYEKNPYIRNAYVVVDLVFFFDRLR